MSLIDSYVWTLGSSLVTLFGKVMELSSLSPESKDPDKSPNGITITFSCDIWALSWDALKLEHPCDFQSTLSGAGFGLEGLHSKETRTLLYCFSLACLPQHPHQPILLPLILQHPLSSQYPQYPLDPLVAPVTKGGLWGFMIWSSLFSLCFLSVNAMWSTGFPAFPCCWHIFLAIMGFLLVEP